MLTTVLVWVLISIDVKDGITYSPPVSTLQDCQRIQQTFERLSRHSSGCVQINMVTK